MGHFPRLCQITRRYIYNYLYMFYQLQVGMIQPFRGNPSVKSTEAHEAWATVAMHILKHFFTTAGWWYTYPSEKYENQLGWLFPIRGLFPSRSGDLQLLNLIIVLPFSRMLCLQPKESTGAARRYLEPWGYRPGKKYSSQCSYQTKQILGSTLKICCFSRTSPIQAPERQ